MNTLCVPARLSDYIIILKPRVMSLVVFTGWVGLMMAPGSVGFMQALMSVACIAIGAGASGAINMWYDRDIDVHMYRTVNRPLPAGRLHPLEVLFMGVFLATGSVVMMAVYVNPVAAGLLMLTILYYVFIYTVWLKRRTSQNVVIGGASGALPPVIGWSAVSGSIEWHAVVLFLIIFLWTPPHSWALALFRRGDYENARVPMLPVVAGEAHTRRWIFIYTLLTVLVSLIPVMGYSGMLYGAGVIVLGAEFLRRAWIMWRQHDDRWARSFFFYSILYLFLLFVLQLADKYLLVTLSHLGA